MARIGRDRHAAVLVAEDVGLLGTELLVVDHTGRAQLRQALRALQADVLLRGRGETREACLTTALDPAQAFWPARRAHSRSAPAAVARAPRGRRRETRSGSGDAAPRRRAGTALRGRAPSPVAGPRPRSSAASPRARRGWRPPTAAARPRARASTRSRKAFATGPARPWARSGSAPWSSPSTWTLA